LGNSCTRRVKLSGINSDPKLCPGEVFSISLGHYCIFFCLKIQESGLKVVDFTILDAFERFRLHIENRNTFIPNLKSEILVQSRVDGEFTEAEEIIKNTLLLN
jgi:hypothetical protein